MGFAIANVLYKNDELTACTTPQIINCSKLNATAARKAWIIRTEACCGGYGLLFNRLDFVAPTDPTEIANMLVGVAVEYDSKLMVLDVGADTPRLAGDPVTVAVHCNCTNCGDDNVIPAQYAGVIPAYAPATTNTYCITRADNGEWYARQQVELDYLNNYITIRQTSATGTVSKYQITATVKPNAIGTDTVAVGVCS